jgi:hypothetical protein
MRHAATRTLAALALAAIAITQPACQPGDLFPAKRTPLMNELTTNMKTVCFGRYLVDVPQKAEFALGLARSDSVDIKAVEATSRSEAAFQAKIDNIERELRAAKHNTEGTRLREVSTTEDGRNRIFVYRKDEVGSLISVVETFARLGDREWLVGHAISDEDVATLKQEISEIVGGLRARSITDIPNSAGACIANGLLNRSPKYGEGFAGGAQIEDLSWSLSLRSETSKPYEPKQRLIVRAEDAISMVGGSSSGIKVLRKREITLDGRKGEEFVALYPGDGVASLSAKLELYGDGTYKVPTLKLTMDANRLSPPDPNDKRVFLSDDEALAVWDAVLKSVRPRPGAF